MEKINYVLTGNCKVIKSQNTYHQNCILLQYGSKKHEKKVAWFSMKIFGAIKFTAYGQ